MERVCWQLEANFAHAGEEAAVHFAWKRLRNQRISRSRSIRMCRSLRASRQIKVAIPCLWLEAMEMAGPWHGPRISGRIGCQTPSSDGRATSDSGFRRLAGLPDRSP